MNKATRILAFIAFFALALAPRARASGSEILEERYKSALNGMVQEIRSAPDAAAKREYLERFLSHMDEGLRQAQGMEGLSQADKAVLVSLAAKYRDYRAELEGTGGFAAVPDSRLDGFAGYIRQGMEQAPIGGGVYISSGVLIIIIILLIILI